MKFLNSLKVLTLTFGILSQSLLLALTPLPQDFRDRIVQLVKTNPGQLSVAEYTSVAQEIFNRAPCNVLVFGVGNDSSLWIDANNGGNTVFLENHPSWIDRVKTSLPQINAELVQYTTERWQWKELLNKGEPDLLLLDLPDSITETKWDIIFVDGPEGWSDEKPGRMQSIFTTALIANTAPDTHVFVHDCDRVVEATYSSLFLGDDHLKAVIDRMRHYYFPSVN